jgi:hypothetical protein
MIPSQARRSLKRYYTVKKLSFFPSPAGMSLTNLSLAGNNLIIPGQGDMGMGKRITFFYSVGPGIKL